MVLSLLAARDALLANVDRLFELLSSDGAINLRPHVWSPAPRFLADTVSGSRQLEKFLSATENEAEPIWQSYGLYKPFQIRNSIWQEPLFPQSCTGSLSGGTCAGQCQNPEVLFSSLGILGNCLTFAKTAVMSENGTVAREEYNDDTPPGWQVYGVPENVNATQILQDVVSCAVTSCQVNSSTSDMATCTPELVDLRQSFDSQVTPMRLSSLETITHALERYCGRPPDTSFNPDIAGPGVVLSQMIQASTALITFVLISFISSWTRLALLVYEGGNWETAETIHKRLTSSTVYGALVSAAVEFQEAQGFFTMAIQIATLATFEPDVACGQSCSDRDWVISLSEAIMNGQLVRALAVNSMLPVLLTQSILHRNGMGWWYTLVMTLGVCTLAETIRWKSTMQPPFSEILGRLKGAEPIAECGGNPALAAYCLAPLYALKMDSIPMLVVGYSTAAVLVLSQVANSIKTWVSITRLVKRGMAAGYLPSSSPFLGYLGKHLFRAGWWGLQIALSIATGQHLVMLWSIGRVVDSAAGEWSYGQVVSAMLWAPVLGKYIYYNLFGVQEGVEARLAREYQVIRRGDNAIEGTPR
ncbi:hypothetical protein QBC35DRAFT_15808 [Podospora australis]|uniref:Uncharacterized protein n=1 Tax=Podospora australis TaxID=1536484 RepID=A0AAN7AEC8_9PEZI|nr:hypothetical protein QBC35DRAFT_15808 [Podospora australis]